MTAYYNENGWSRRDDARPCAYLITNLANGKAYVGITTLGPNWRWSSHLADARRGSKYALHGALRKYGSESFRFEVIAIALDVADLPLLERELIVQRGTRAPFGYNLTDGGEGALGYRHTVETRRKIGEAGRGKTRSPATREIMGRTRIGVPLTAEHRAKLSAAKVGKRMPPRSDEHRARISAGLVAAHRRRRERSL